jgi:hypothetical protein
MGTSLTGTKPKDTYDSLIKVGDNGPISGTAKVLSDGLGNDLPIAVSTSNVGIGTSSPAVKLHVKGAAETGSVLRLEPTTSTTIYSQVVGNNGDIQIEADPLNNEGSSAIKFTVDGTERLRLTANGLTFNGDTAAANALDDYEEGTWTMGIAFGGASVGVTYATNTGTYTKIGRQVTVNGYIVLTSKGSSTGGAIITGLPFAVGGGNQFFNAISLRTVLILNTGTLQGYANQTLTSIELESVSVLGVTTTTTNADFANNSTIMVSATYFV